ncbi:hypothetical protein AB0878_04680 [Amycolatopsis sp. NPDC047767]|uniref:hypothetical protein n=1 Tax=Amycolatopsis sp. NPDC047767 TaxID=3156765 RepID=UPI0034514B61
MTDSSAAEQRRDAMLRASGLVVVKTSTLADGPQPRDAWRPVISGHAVPTATVAFGSGEDYVSEVDRKWESIAEDRGIFGNDGEFLISVGGGGLGILAWAQVRRVGSVSLARNLDVGPEEPEFVAMSLDGRTVCGVTAEEYDMWIVAVDLS